MNSLIADQIRYKYLLICRFTYLNEWESAFIYNIKDIDLTDKQIEKLREIYKKQRFLSKKRCNSCTCKFGGCK